MKKLSAKKLWAIAAGLAFLGWMIPETPQAKAARQQSDQARAAAQSAEQRRRSAFLAARRLIETQLKAPATAEWSSYPATTITEGGGGQLVVSGWVDSQNSFGAQVRTKYVLTLAPNGESWRAVDLKLP